MTEQELMLQNYIENLRQILVDAQKKLYDLEIYLKKIQGKAE